MNNHLSCVKCNSNDIIKISSNDTIILKHKLFKYFNSYFIPFLNVDKFICTSCGYIEYYLKSQEDIELSKNLKLAKELN